MIHLDCPRLYSCNAALCPLQPEWREVQHLLGEGVCYYALQSGKPDAAEQYAADPTFAAVVAVLPEVLAKHPDIRHKVAVAAKSGFPGANAGNLHRKHASQGDYTCATVEITPPTGVPGRPAGSTPVLAYAEAAR